MTTKIAIASRSSPKIADSTATTISSSMSGSKSDSATSSRMSASGCFDARFGAPRRRSATSSAVSPSGRLAVRSHSSAGVSAWTGVADESVAGCDAGVALAMKRMICRQCTEIRSRVWDQAYVAHNWLLITVSTPSRGTSTLRVYAWRNLRRLGADHLQQSVCLLPATPKTAAPRHGW